MPNANAQGLKNSDHRLVIAAGSIFAAWIPLFYLLCHFGESVTTSYGMIGDEIFMKLWYFCPLEQQKYILLMIQSGQQPVYFEGFARFDCSRETFRKVPLIFFLRELMKSFGFSEGILRLTSFYFPHD